MRQKKEREIVVTGKLGDAVKEALIKKGRNNHENPQKENSQKNSLKEDSLKEQLLRAGRKFLQDSQDSGIQDIFKEAALIGADPKIVKLFAETIRTADLIGIKKLAFDRPRKKAIAEWFSLSWEEQEEKIQEWARSGESLAGDVVEVLRIVKQNTALWDNLRKIIIRFERPCRRIKNLLQLRSFLDALVEEGLVHRIYQPSHIPNQGVVIPFRSGKFLYLPKTEIPIVKLGWVFIKEKEEKVKIVQKEFDSLKAKASFGLTPSKVSANEEGKLFLVLGPSSAVLLDCRIIEKEMTVSVVEAVGLKQGVQIPSEPLLWKDRHEKGVKKWPDSRISPALKCWEEKLAHWKKERAEKQKEIKDKINSLVSQATLPVVFEEQGLIRLFRGEKGSCAIWHRDFNWGKQKGFFGIVLKRTNEGFFLQKVITIHSFNRELIGKKLPLVIDTDKLLFKLEQTPHLKEMYSSLKMIEKLLALRLKAEKAISKEPSEESGKSGNNDN